MCKSGESHGGALKVKDLLPSQGRVPGPLQSVRVHPRLPAAVPGRWSRIACDRTQAGELCLGGAKPEELWWRSLAVLTSTWSSELSVEAKDQSNLLVAGSC